LLLFGAGSTHRAIAGWGEEPQAQQAAKFDFQLDDLVRRSDVQMKELSAKPLVVHMWAPDCPMCQRNMPFVKGTFQKIDTDDVNFVACSMGGQNETAAYVREHKLPFKVLYKGHDKDYISESFTSDGWPTSFVFAPGGELIGSCDAQGVEYEKKMLELVAEAVKKIKAHEPPKPVKHWY
jgi:peroxiredoxin